MEGEEGVGNFISWAFREDSDGDAGFYFIYCFQYGFQSFFYVSAVKEKAVKVFHPVYQEGITQHFFFGNVSGWPGHSCVSQQNIEIAAVIAHI